MIPTACKRLAEVDFPIAEVSRHAAREKSIRHGHPSTLHLWWARRPLASSRAVLLALLLLPDPCDPHCPAALQRPCARETLLGMKTRPSEDGTSRLETDEGLRRRLLLKFIADFANWDNSAKARISGYGPRPCEAPRIRRRRPWWWTPSQVAGRSLWRRFASAARRSPATSTPSPA